jgi:hypothetical protein
VAPLEEPGEVRSVDGEAPETEGSPSAALDELACTPAEAVRARAAPAFAEAPPVAVLAVPAPVGCSGPNSRLALARGVSLDEDSAADAGPPVDPAADVEVGDEPIVEGRFRAA